MKKHTGKLEVKHETQKQHQQAFRHFTTKKHFRRFMVSGGLWPQRCQAMETSFSSQVSLIVLPACRRLWASSKKKRIIFLMILLLGAEAPSLRNCGLASTAERTGEIRWLYSSKDCSVVLRDRKAAWAAVRNPPCPWWLGFRRLGVLPRPLNGCLECCRARL